MRSQTPSFVVSVKLKLSESVENHLEKSFNIANSAYNEALSFGLKRFEALKQNFDYQNLLEARRSASAGIIALKKARQKTVGLRQQVKLYNQALFNLQKNYGVTEYGLQSHLAVQRRKVGTSYRHLSAGELQVIASHAYKALERVLFYQIKPHKVQFRSKYDLNVSYRNRVNTESTRLEKSDRNGIAYRLYLHKVSTFVDIPAKAFNTYQQMSLLRCEKIKYVQIIRKTI